ncbi:hypothetical protein ACIRQQ_36965 [Streptomyces fuscichromogenes]|uniref:hypothetical protein n=1 Tax=Streptomyces fuscichromogenes TaxID=1324013 RepID=UPI003817EC9C
MTTDTELPEFIPTHAAPTAIHADDINVRWVMPEIFHDLPVQEKDEDEAVRLLEELADKALPGAGEEDRTRLAVICALSTGDLMAAAVDYASICVTAVDEALCTATVFVSLTDSPEAAGGVRGAAKELASGLRRTGTDEVSEIELPCGLAVSCIGTRDTKLTGELAGDDEPANFLTWYIRVYVPLPNDTTVIMEMQTPTMAGWDVFSTMFGNTVSSLRLFRADGSRLITSEAGA